MPSLAERLGQIEVCLDGIRSMLAELHGRQVVRDFYTVEQLAELIGRSTYTVRQWCREGRIKADRRRDGRGRHKSWVISHQEVQRVQKEGLLPRQRHRVHQVSE